MDKFGTARPTWSKLSDPPPNDQASTSTSESIQGTALQGNEPVTSQDEIILGMHAGADQRAEELAEEVRNFEELQLEFKKALDREEFMKRYVCY